VGPKVTVIGESFLLSGRAEGLTGTRSRPYWPFIIPSRKPERPAPSPDTGEEVVLIETFKVRCLDIGYAPVIYHAMRYQALIYQIREPSGYEGVVFVVIYHLHPTFRLF
jgi:hypothetical protein